MYVKIVVVVIIGLHHIEITCVQKPRNTFRCIGVCYYYRFVSHVNHAYGSLGKISDVHISHSIALINTCEGHKIKNKILMLFVRRINNEIIVWLLVYFEDNKIVKSTSQKFKSRNKWSKKEVRYGEMDLKTHKTATKLPQKQEQLCNTSTVHWQLNVNMAKCIEKLHSLLRREIKAEMTFGSYENHKTQYV